jgi:hypothetical protein
MQSDGMKDRIEALDDLLRGNLTVAQLRAKFANFPRENFDEESIDMTVVGACDRYRNGGRLEAFRHVLEDTLDYCKRR